MSEVYKLSPEALQRALTGTPQDRQDYCDALLADSTILMEQRLEIVRIVSAPSLVDVVAGIASPPATGFFEKGKMLTANVAEAVRQNIAVGPGDSFYLYDGGVWRSEPAEVERRCVRMLGNSFVKGQVATVSTAVIHHPQTPRIGVRPDSRYINTLSGLYGWEANTIEPHRADALSTIQLPIVYDPDAECPVTDAWLAQILDADVIPVVWEVLGYLMMTGNPHHVAVLLYGPGGTGKSTFLKLVESLIGSSNRSTASYTQLTGDKFTTVQLLGKLANLCGDITGSFNADTSTFKALTGEDSVTVQRKYGQPFDMLNFAVPVFSTNEFWPSSDTSTGYFDRWLVLPFLRPVSGKFDESTLHAEASGIFNKAAGALRALQARESGKRSTRFTQSASVAAVKDEMRGISDSVFMWLKEDTAVVQDVTKMGIRSDVYSRYVFWCWDSELGGGITPVGARKFWPKIRSAGYIDHKSDGKRYVVGLHVAQEKVSA